MVGHQQARAESRMHACVCPRCNSVEYPSCGRAAGYGSEGERGGGEGGEEEACCRALVMPTTRLLCNLHPRQIHKHTDRQTKRTRAHMHGQGQDKGIHTLFKRATLLASKRRDHHQIGASTPRPLRLPPPALACLVTAPAAPLAFIIKFPCPVVSPSFLSMYTQTQRVESST